MIRGAFRNRIPYRRGCVARLRSLGLVFMLAASAATGESGRRTGLDPRLRYERDAAGRAGGLHSIELGHHRIGLRARSRRIGRDPVGVSIPPGKVPVARTRSWLSC